MEIARTAIEPLIKSIPDFPKKGINFRDIMPIFAKPDVVALLCQAVAEHAKQLKVEAIAGLEARGFLFGPQVAMLVGLPFIPIRKKGKLPGECVQASYVKEYGEDIVEVQKDAISSGMKVLIVDDLLATGGTLKAAVKLVEKAGGIASGAFVIIELEELQGRKGLNLPITSLLAYEHE